MLFFRIFISGQANIRWTALPLHFVIPKSGAHNVVFAVWWSDEESLPSPES
jgi:hypothetical protein